MNKETIGLIEAVRDLRLAVVEAEAVERVRIGGAADDFPRRLVALARALEAFDRAGGARAEASAAPARPEAGMETGKLKNAIDGMFKWMRGQGIDISQPYAILEEAMGIPPEKRKKGLAPKPRYAAGAKRTRKPSQFKIRLLPGEQARRDEDAAAPAPGRP